MKIYIKVICILLILSSAESFSQSAVSNDHNVKKYGAAGDGITLDTEAIQKSIDECSISGGTVYFPPGRYLIGSLELKSNIDIYIETGAVILGSTNISDYKEHTPQLKSYNDAFLKHSLFYAERAENISITGYGTIDGQGSAYKVLTREKPERYKNRPFVLRFVECKNVRIENITMQNSAMWMQQYLACEDLFIRGIKVYNHANQNNDMMDIDGCKNVIISDCIGDTDDDGITLKSTSPGITENVVINNCVISSHCNAIKLGTESTGGFRNISVSNIVIKPSGSKTKIYGFDAGICGINLSTVDGGILEGITISNIRIDGPQTAIYMRLGNRGRKYVDDAPQPGIGTFKNIMISDIVASNIGPVGCSITGIPGHLISDVYLNNIKIEFSGGGTNEDASKIPAELEDHYPESTMWGNLPAYGFFIRHVEGAGLSNIDLSYNMPDCRPAFALDDVSDIKLSGITAEINSSAKCLIDISRASNVYIQNIRVNGRGKTFVGVNDSLSKNIYITGNYIGNFDKPAVQKKPGQVILNSNICK